MKIAFATNDSVHINAHFGSASQVDVYDGDAQGFQFLETIEFQRNLQEDGNEDKLEPKMNALQDCNIVYVSAIGPSAASRLIRHNITPIKVESSNDEIQEVLTDLMRTMSGNPPPWLRKVLLKSKPRHFDDDFEMIEEEVTL